MRFIGFIGIAAVSAVVVAGCTKEQANTVITDASYAADMACVTAGVLDQKDAAQIQIACQLGKYALADIQKMMSGAKTGLVRAGLALPEPQ